jgi:uncharacterized protein
MTTREDRVLAETRAWVDRAVIGLNLCPFAKAVQVNGRIRYVATSTDDPEQLLATLCDELRRLADADPSEVETTLLVHPDVLGDFDDFNQFLGPADAALRALGLEGVIQIASFHPQYRFAGTDADDITNATNRAPHPCLHLLREDSIDRAVAAFPEPEAIYEANMRTLQALGHIGWEQLMAQCRRDAGQAAKPDQYPE